MCPDAVRTDKLALIASKKEDAIKWRFDPELKIRLLVMQPTAFCNISCDYCYLARRDDSRVMPLSVVRDAADNVRSSGLLDQYLGVVWHAGEPLVAPRDFYESAFQILANRLGTVTNLQHSIQTNGTLIDQRWCQLFARWRIRVGVSIDGPAHIHDRHRKTRKGKPTHSLVMRGIEQLQNAEIPFHVIAVVTRDSLDSAQEIVEFFASHGIHEVGFNIDEKEGSNTTCTVTDEGERYRAFLRRLIELERQSAANLSIREVRVAKRLILSELPRISIGQMSIPDNPQILPFAILTVAANGDFSTFSPELVDQRHPIHGPFTFGNVSTSPIRSILADERFQLLFGELIEGVEQCRASCEYFSFCGGGAPVNKLAEHGSLASAETVYCRSVIKEPLEAVLHELETHLFPDECQTS